MLETLQSEFGNFPDIIANWAQRQPGKVALRDGERELTWGELGDRVERIAAVPVNQLIMVKLAMNSALLNQGVANSAMISTVFDMSPRRRRTCSTGSS